MAPPLRGIITITITTTTLVPRGGLKSDFPAIGPIASGVKKRRPTNKVLWEPMIIVTMAIIVLVVKRKKLIGDLRILGNGNNSSKKEEVDWG